MEMRPQRRALDKIYKRRDRYEIPDWQREEVWGRAKKQKLIDTILRGWTLPKLYFAKTSENPEEFEVVDGQQRLTTIWEFFDGDLKLSKASAQKFGADSYSDLSDTLSDAFDDYEIQYDEIVDATDEELKQFFQRLQEGLPLTSSEKLNSVHSKLRDFCARLAKHKFFSDTTRVANKRYAFFDMCAKVTTLEIEGLDAGLRYDDIQPVFKSNSGFSGQSAVAKRIKKALDLLNSSLPSPYSYFRNRTLVQSFVTLTCHLLHSGFDAKKGESLRRFSDHFLSELGKQVELGQQASDPDYLAFQRTVNANVRSGPKTRQEILMRKLFRFDPTFFSTLSQTAEMTLGVKRDIKATAKAIRDLISDINDQYSGVHGRDLFKATNKTAKALTGLGDAVHDSNDYTKFIDNLYFVFRESTGQRLATIPDSFADANDLRTMVQHDVDHGKAGKAAAKRRKLGKVFKKYAGTTTSHTTLDPGLFPLCQSNILAALASDLRNLQSSGFGT